MRFFKVFYYINLFIKNIKSLIEEILNYKINTTFYSKKNSIGPCIGIIHLIESSFGFDKKQIKSMMEKYKNLKNYNFFRPVKGDGNCYYRGFMYKYLETIILNNDIELFKDLLLNFEDCFNDKITKKYLKVSSNNIIKPEKIKNILVAIYYSIYEKNIKKSLRILNSAFNLSKNFDIALILFFRYELYKFINENQFKFYTETFPVLIGNLLPAEYETKDGLKNTSLLFVGCSSIISLNLSNFNTNNVTKMSFMFNECSSLISLNLSNFNTNNVTNMYAMFNECSSLTSLNLSYFSYK